MLSDENRNGTQKTQVYMPSRGMNAQKSHLISDPDVDKAFKYHGQYPGVMQGSQERKCAKLWGPRAHFGANISMKILSKKPFNHCTWEISILSYPKPADKLVWLRVSKTFNNRTWDISILSYPQLCQVRLIGDPGHTYQFKHAYRLGVTKH